MGLLFALFRNGFRNPGENGKPRGAQNAPKKTVQISIFFHFFSIFLPSRSHPAPTRRSGDFSCQKPISRPQDDLRQTPFEVPSASFGDTDSLNFWGFAHLRTASRQTRAEPCQNPLKPLDLSRSEQICAVLRFHGYSYLKSSFSRVIPRFFKKQHI